MNAWCEVLLPDGRIILVDPEDLAVATRYSWRAVKAPNTDIYYARAKVDGRSDNLHRVILGVPKELDVDHRNHNGLDNRRANLRPCTDSQNLGNRRINHNNTSGYKGVHLFYGKWRARIGYQGDRLSLGMFTDPWDAAQAYNHAATELFGEFARLNEYRPQAAQGAH